MPYDTSSAGGFLAGAGIITLIIFLAIAVFVVMIYWRIASKAGYPGAMSLLLFIPVANLVMLLIFAFSEWPIQKELNQLRAMAARGGSGAQFPQQYGQPQPPQFGQPSQFGQPQPPQYGQPQPPQYGQPPYPQR